MERTDLEAWLDAYGTAWQGKNPEAAAQLFSGDARYYETPFADPFEGRSGIADYWSRVTADQQNIEFAAAVVGIAGDTSVARWSARFTTISGGAPVELNGIFLLRFDARKLCTELREWWHVR